MHRVYTNLHGLCWQKILQGSSGNPFLKAPDNAIVTNCNIVAIGDQKGTSICAGDFLANTLNQLHQGDMKSQVGTHMHGMTREHRNNLSTITGTILERYRDRFSLHNIPFRVTMILVLAEG